MEKVRVQDDLFNFVNGEWLETAVIPDDRPVTGGFASLDQGVEETMRAEITGMCESGKFPNVYLERACKLYQLGVDVKRRKKDGIKPVLKTLKVINSLKDVKALNRKLSWFVTEGLPLPFEMGVEVDMKNAKQHLMYIQGPSTILPDTTYYKDEVAAQRDAMLGLWSNMAKGLLAQCKLEEAEINEFVSDALKFDAIIATLVKSSEEMSEYTKMYNVIPFKKLCSSLKPLKVKKLFEELYDGVLPEKVSSADPRFLKGFKELFNEENFVLFKHWAYIGTLISASSILSEELRELGSTFKRALSGVAKISSPERFAYQLSCFGVFAEPVGIYYGEKYFGEKAKADVVSMVKEIIKTYQDRVRKNEFLEEATKEKAILKLSTIVIKMGYPDKARALYEKLVFEDTDSFYQAVTKLERIKRLDSLAKLYKPVDRSEWAMPGHMVNACYNPFANDITFPAAILQPPFYSINQTRSQNLGGIGAVIGHEISHAFDNNGANFDETGNIANWWTKGDFKNFQAKTKAMIKEFEGIELPWGKVNSKLIVSENIADNGGMAVTLEIMKGMSEKSYEEYFLNWGKVWCQKAKDQYRALLLNVDVHAPAILRANMQPRNFSEWYEEFKVTKKDKMYIAPNKRVVIW